MTKAEFQKLKHKVRGILKVACINSWDIKVLKQFFDEVERLEKLRDE